MKKLNLTITTIIILTITAFIFQSCNNDEPKTLTVDSFAKYGEIHNNFLTNIKNNFDFNKDLKNNQEKVEYINDFNKEFVNTLDLPLNEKNIMLEGFDSHKSIVKTENLTNLLLPKNKDNDKNLFELIDELKNNPAISTNSINILNILASNLKNGYENHLPNSELKIVVLDLIDNYNNYGYDLNSGEGVMIGTILSISISSINWWEENPEAAIGGEKLFPWLAADVAGAVVGAVISAGVQQAVVGEINWTVVAGGAVVAAIASSTGVVGRIAKWLL